MRKPQATYNLAFIFKKKVYFGIMRVCLFLFAIIIIQIHNLVKHVFAQAMQDPGPLARSHTHIQARQQFAGPKLRMPCSCWAHVGIIAKECINTCCRVPYGIGYWSGFMTGPPHFERYLLSGLGLVFGQLLACLHGFT